MNSVTLVGNVVNDLELKTYTNEEGEGKVVNFRLAVNDYVGKEIVTSFINIVAFGRKAEILNQYITKGRKLAIEGKLRTGSYVNSEGQKRYIVEIVLSDFTFVDSRRVVNEEVQINNSEIPF